MPEIPLTPKQGGMCILNSALQPADIIVSTTQAVASRVIRGSTHSLVSHVILYAGHSQVIEAIQEGVSKRSLGVALDKAKHAVAYRVKNLSPRQANVVVTYARGKVLRKYDTGGALGGGARANPALCKAVVGSVLAAATPLGQPLTSMALSKDLCKTAANGDWQDSNKYYCSELVLESFQRSGIRISHVRPSVSVPQDIVDAANLGILEYVGHLRH